MLNRYRYRPISAIFADIGISRYIGIFADIGIGRYISIFGQYLALLIPSQQLYFCCSPWWKSNLQSWFAIILFQFVLQLMHRGFFQLMVMLSHLREIIYYPKMHKKSCTCMKICHFWGLTTENCEILPINIVSMQFMKISVSVKIYRHFCRYIGIGRVVSVQHYFFCSDSSNTLQKNIY